jgi:hypothetical protein
MPTSLRPGLARFSLLVVFLASLSSLIAGPAVAGDDPPATPQPEVEQIKVAAVLCNDWSCFEFGDRLNGFTITAIDLDSQAVLDSCVTDTSSEFEGCLLEVPFGAKWGLTFDDAQTPEGYIYHGSVIAVSGGAHGEMTYIPFHPLEDPEPGHSVVQAALCTDASCDEVDEYLDDFWIQAVNPETDQVYDECRTGNAQQGLDHQCILDVPAKGVVEYRWNEDQVPDGYVPFGEPIVGGDPVVTTLAFVPEDGATPEPGGGPVTRLPVTGGTQPAGDVDGGVMSVIVVVAGVLLAVAGIAQVKMAGKRRP